MDPESFASGSFILSYDSCPEMCSGSRTHLPKTGTLEIEADFKTAPILEDQLRNVCFEIDKLAPGFHG